MVEVKKVSKLLRSRKFVLAITVIAVQLLVLAIPDLRPYASEIGGVLFATVATLGGLITFEDSVKAWVSRPVDWKAAVREAVEEILSIQPSLPSGPDGIRVAGIIRDEMPSAYG